MCILTVDHQVTEEMFINNMWISVNQPNFKELVINNVSDSTFINAYDLYG